MQFLKWQTVKRSILYIGSIWLISQSVWAQSDENATLKLSPVLLRQIETAQPDDKVKVIVELKRKASRPYRPEELLSPRAIARRMKMVRSGALPSVITPEDLPFDETDLKILTASGLRIRHVLKWLGAVSGEIRVGDLVQLALQSAVKSVNELALRKKAKHETHRTQLETPTEVLTSEVNHLTNAIDYGQSLPQLALSNIPEVHGLGITGRGVLIANFDAGFSNLSHEAFRSLRVVAQYDFVANQSQLGAHPHGAATMGVIAGNQPGRLIGAAFGADYALARTEDARTETPVEEDNWAAAAQWADSLGADIITSSLGYTEFDPPFPPYTWQQMDGKTAISTRAAARAARVGIVVVNSAGNGGMIALPANTLGAPADADTLISVGAVTSSGARAPFSSVGPTADGRIKPDVMAMGAAVFTVGTSTPSSYATANGTSFSCPITAGVAALLLSANPTLTPVQVRNILRETASNSAAPNREIGWGIVNARAALERARQVSATASVSAPPKTFELYQNYPNPFNPITQIRYRLPVRSKVRLEVFDMLGRRITTLVEARQEAGEYQTRFNAENLPSGIYLLRLQAGGFSDTKKMLLVK